MNMSQTNPMGRRQTKEEENWSVVSRELNGQMKRVSNDLNEFKPEAVLVDIKTEQKMKENQES